MELPRRSLHLAGDIPEPHPTPLCRLALCPHAVVAGVPKQGHSDHCWVQGWKGLDNAPFGEPWQVVGLEVTKIQTRIPRPDSVKSTLIPMPPPCHSPWHRPLELPILDAEQEEPKCGGSTSCPAEPSEELLTPRPSLWWPLQEWALETVPRKPCWNMLQLGSSNSQGLSRWRSGNRLWGSVCQPLGAQPWISAPVGQFSVFLSLPETAFIGRTLCICWL